MTARFGKFFLLSSLSLRVSPLRFAFSGYRRFRRREGRTFARVLACLGDRAWRRVERERERAVSALRAIGSFAISRPDGREKNCATLAARIVSSECRVVAALTLVNARILARNSRINRTIRARARAFSSSRGKIRGR